MFKRPHHQRIHLLLQSLNADLLTQTECYFGGGTAIVLALNEYRESVDVDFLCASADGYRYLRNTINENSLGELLKQPVALSRQVKADRYGIRTFCVIDSVPIKFEIVREDRIDLVGISSSTLPVPELSRIDMYAEKLLANTDRWADTSANNRDIIDLSMMIHHWGAIPVEAWDKVRQAYGASAEQAFLKAIHAVTDEAHLARCLVKMGMDGGLGRTICEALTASALRLQRSKNP